MPKGAGYDLPRPALGRRPWFALRRRARRRLRFAFAIGGKGSRPFVELSAGADWRSGPVLLASAPIDRLHGSGRGAVLLRSRSVHGVGLAAPLPVAAIVQGRVEAVGRLRPGEIVLRRGAVWWLEMPAGGLPDPGATVRVHARRRGP